MNDWNAAHRRLDELLKLEKQNMASTTYQQRRSTQIDAVYRLMPTSTHCLIDGWLERGISYKEILAGCGTALEQLRRGQVPTGLILADVSGDDIVRSLRGGERP